MTKYFHIVSRSGQVKELDEKEYLKRLNRGNYHLGWIDSRDIYFVLPTMLSKFQLMDIEKLGGWAI